MIDDCAGDEYTSREELAQVCTIGYAASQIALTTSIGDASEGESAMNGVIVKMVGSTLVVEVDILKAIVEGVGGGRPISTVKPGPKPKTPTSSA